MLTISSIECPIDGTTHAGAAADYVLSRADRPTAFARGDYYVADEDIDTQAPQDSENTGVSGRGKGAAPLIATVGDPPLVRSLLEGQSAPPVSTGFTRRGRDVA